MGPTDNRGLSPCGNRAAYNRKEPVKPGDRIKTDRRDAKRLLGHFAAGQLTEVYPPNPQQETDREMTRCRGVAQENLKRIRHQLVKFLTRPLAD